LNASDLESKTMVELYETAKNLEIQGYYKLRKKELIFEIVKVMTSKEQSTLFAMGSCDPSVMFPARTISMFPRRRSGDLT